MFVFFSTGNANIRLIFQMFLFDMLTKILFFVVYFVAMWTLIFLLIQTVIFCQMIRKGLNRCESLLAHFAFPLCIACFKLFSCCWKVNVVSVMNFYFMFVKVIFSIKWFCAKATMKCVTIALMICFHMMVNSPNVFVTNSTLLKSLWNFCIWIRFRKLVTLSSYVSP